MIQIIGIDLSEYNRIQKYNILQKLTCQNIQNPTKVQIQDQFDNFLDIFQSVVIRHFPKKKKTYHLLHLLHLLFLNFFLISALCSIQYISSFSLPVIWCDLQCIQRSICCIQRLQPLALLSWFSVVIVHLGHRLLNRCFLSSFRWAAKFLMI